MKPWERRLFNGVSLVVAVTGFAYFWMKYLLQTDDPFALVNHPWQGTMLAWHVVASPLMLLIFGVVLNSHVMKKLRVKGMANRRTGYTSLATFVAMVTSGYLLQVVVNPTVINALVTVHVTTGVIFTAAYVTHLVISWRMSRRARRSNLASVA